MRKLFAILLFLTFCSNAFAGLFDFFKTSLSSDCTNGVCNVYLLDDIKDPINYQDVYKTLLKAKKGETVYLHLAGPGGAGDGLIYLLNAIKASEADVISVVDGNVASCDAVLAVATKKTIFTGDAYIYFHNISTSNMSDEICREQTGTDRGLSMYNKCMEDLPKITAFFNKVVNRYVYPVLTPKERADYDNGHDIIIDNVELTKRLNHGR